MNCPDCGLPYAQVVPGCGGLHDPAPAAPQAEPKVPQQPKFARLRTPAGYRRARAYWMADARWCQWILRQGRWPADRYQGGPVTDLQAHNLAEGVKHAAQRALRYNRLAWQKARQDRLYPAPARQGTQVLV